MESTVIIYNQKAYGTKTGVIKSYQGRPSAVDIALPMSQWNRDTIITSNRKLQCVRLVFPGESEYIDLYDYSNYKDGGNGNLIITVIWAD
jgi:hypothetical protein